MSVARGRARARELGYMRARTDDARRPRELRIVQGDGACVRAFVRACVRAFVHACVRVFACPSSGRVLASFLQRCLRALGSGADGLGVEAREGARRVGMEKAGPLVVPAGDEQRNL
eukprot:159626-Pleurochrysis_carterae.AAC.1